MKHLLRAPITHEIVDRDVALEISRLQKLVASRTCAGLRFGREPRAEYEAKSTVRFIAGTHELPGASADFSAELIEEVRFGPAAELATPDGPGAFRVIRFPSGCNQTACT